MVEERPADQIVKLLEPVTKRLWHDWCTRNRALPPDLYHYTNATGLLGILEKNQLWATDTCYLNDRSELRYGRDLVSEVLEEALPECFGSLAHCFLDFARDMFHPYQERTEAFVFSLSTEGNLLSQWRAYADGGKGYNIGLQARGLTRYHRSDQNPKLLAVIYDREEQMKRVRELIYGIAQALHDNAEPLLGVMNEIEIGVRAHDVARLFIDEYLLSFKDPSFGEEKEWRLVQLQRDPAGYEVSDVGFRVTPAGITPYIELDCSVIVHSTSRARLPISCITVGPNANYVLARQALEQLLHRRGFVGVEIKPSRIPLRS